MTDPEPAPSAPVCIQAVKGVGVEVAQGELVTMSGDAKQMLDDPKVRAAYLGA